jgi:hypothetical protein
MFAKFVVIILRAIVSFLSVVSKMMIFIYTLDEIGSGSVGLTGLGDVFTVARDDLVQLYYTWVTQLKQIIELTIGTFGVGGILIGVTNLFDGEYLLGLFVLYFIDLTVCAFAQKAEDLVSFIYMVVDFGLVFLHVKYWI